MFVIACTYVFISIAMWLFLVPEPEEVGIEMAAEEAEFYGTNQRYREGYH